MSNWVEHALATAASSRGKRHGVITRSIRDKAIHLALHRKRVDGLPRGTLASHLALAQLRDLVLAEAELGEHFLGLLAKLRRSPPGKAGYSLHQVRLLYESAINAIQRDVARQNLSEYLCSAAPERSPRCDLVVREQLVDRLDPSARHAGGAEFGDSILPGAASA